MLQLMTEDGLESFWQAKLHSTAPAAGSSDAARWTSASAQHRSDPTTPPDIKHVQLQHSNSHASQQRAAGATQQPEQLASLPDARTNLLVQRLYRHKLNQLMAHPTTTLCSCSQCGAIFAVLHRHKFHCSHDRAGLAADADLHVVSSRHHVADKTWKSQRQGSEPAQQRITVMQHAVLPQPYCTRPTMQILDLCS